MLFINCCESETSSAAQKWALSAEFLSRCKSDLCCIDAYKRVGAVLMLSGGVQDSVMYPVILKEVIIIIISDQIKSLF